MSVLEPPVAELDADSVLEKIMELHEFFCVDVQFSLLTGEGESHQVKDALEVSMGRFNHPYKIN